jgi:hypothetical protein
MDSTHSVTSRPTGFSIPHILSVDLTPLIVHIILGCLLVSSATAAPEDYGLATNREHQAIVNITFVDPVTGELRSDGIEIGRFGSESRLDTEWGIVVHIRTIDNRTDGCNSPPINAPSERWIALIERGACNFQLKIHNAAIVSNASAVVVYNHQDDTSLITMKHTGKLQSIYCWNAKPYCDGVIKFSFMFEWLSCDKFVSAEELMRM